MPAKRTKPVSGRARPVKPSSESASLATVQDPVELAKLTLQAICRDAASPSAARAQAARTLLELAGALKSGIDNSAKPATEMSASEIDQRLEALARADTGADT